MVRPAALGQYASPQVADSEVTLLVPVGSVEQHGPHLPLDTDTRIAVAVAAGTRSALSDPAHYVIAPEIAYGASGEHEGFAGTISLGQEALAGLLIEFGRSACRWARRIVFVNGHGGNVATLATAVRTLRYERREVTWYACAFPGGDAHAGHTETSILLHLSPESVRIDRLEPGNCEPMGVLMGAMRSGGVVAVSENGILGDPRSATAEHGADLLGGAVADLARAVAGWTVDDGGRLR
ncbi:mycofactocin biosynthesis peptidyl-dipeptidase MftE [Gordonia sp. DT30]|uniref:mycofactocin biosynthesis peptidyl-dipeptidase MftE n=1 Tax=unclassified Gordonia (in: high G+C Gram-positive bacteria) TaxID=2657482 RepID=UPI003CEA02C5